jgi:hypothetical protein
MTTAKSLGLIFLIFCSAICFAESPPTPDKSETQIDLSPYTLYRDSPAKDNKLILDTQGEKLRVKVESSFDWNPLVQILAIVVGAVIVIWLCRPKPATL